MGIASHSDGERRGRLDGTSESLSAVHPPQVAFAYPASRSQCALLRERLDGRSPRARVHLDQLGF